MSLSSPSTLALPRVTHGPPARFSLRRLALATPIALATSLAAILVIRGFAAGADTAAFPPLRVASELPLATLGVLAAAATCWRFELRVQAPVRAFRRVAPIALLISLVPDAAIWASHVYPETSAGTVLPLMAMHVAVAAVCIGAFSLAGRAAD